MRVIQSENAVVRTSPGGVENNPNRRIKAEEYQAAEDISTQIVLPDNEITRYGSVSAVGMSDGAFVSLTLTPGTAEKEFIIGDPYGLIAAAMSGRGFVEPTSVAGSSPAAFKASTQQGIAIKGMHYQVTVSKTQFANPLNYVSGNYDGSSRTIPIQVLGTTRPDWQNDKLTVIEFKNFLKLDSRNALALKVNAGETVNLTLFVAAFGY